MKKSSIIGVSVFPPLILEKNIYILHKGRVDSKPFVFSRVIPSRIIFMEHNVAKEIRSPCCASRALDALEFRISFILPPPSLSSTLGNSGRSGFLCFTPKSSFPIRLSLAFFLKSPVVAEMELVPQIQEPLIYLIFIYVDHFSEGLTS